MLNTALNTSTQTHWGEICYCYKLCCNISSWERIVLFLSFAHLLLANLVSLMSENLPDSNIGSGESNDNPRSILVPHTYKLCF